MIIKVKNNTIPVENQRNKYLIKINQVLSYIFKKLHSLIYSKSYEITRSVIIFQGEVLFYHTNSVIV